MAASKNKKTVIKEKVEQEVLSDAKNELEELEAKIEKMFIEKLEQKFSKLDEMEKDLKRIKERMGL